MYAHNGAESVGMTAEGDRVAQRRTRLGMTVKALAEAAEIDRATLAGIEKGHGFRADTMRRIERALDQAEEESGLAVPEDDPQKGLIEFEVSGDFGVHVVVRGPVGDAEALERSVVRLVRDIRASSSQGVKDEENP